MTARSGQPAHMMTSIRSTVTNTPVLSTCGLAISCTTQHHQHHQSSSLKLNIVNHLQRVTHVHYWLSHQSRQQTNDPLIISAKMNVVNIGRD